MKKNKFALQIISFCLIILSFIACDTDYSHLNSDVVNSDVATHFGIKDSLWPVIAYTKKLGPVQTNGVGLTTLGVYDDAYGRTTSSFVTQVSPSSYNPVFGEDVKLDSVVVTIPYYSTATGVEDNGRTTYKVDSVISKGDDYKPIKLSIFENNYFIRDFDPNAEFNEEQAYFSDKSTSTSDIPIGSLEGEELIFTDNSDPEGEVVGNTININNKERILIDVNELDEDGNEIVLFRQPPSVRIKLDTTYWRQKIINKEGDPVLSNQNNFADYFRGLYFKAEPVNNDGSYIIFNTSPQGSSNITIYYTRLTTSSTDADSLREQSTYVIKFGSNKINFIDNDFALPIIDGNENTGDSEIYLKGGEGAIAGVKLFEGVDDETGLSNFDKFRNDFVNLENDKYKSSKRLVNEANLVFYVDRDQLDALSEDPENEPNRLYLYDMDNKMPLLDYFLDVTSTDLPSISKPRHLGPLRRVDEEYNGKGIKYKMKITEHINNLLLRDSTNVELGLAVSLNVNIEDPNVSNSQNKVKSGVEPDLTVPKSSILTPRGTILHGNTTPDESKRVYLEIYYTEPN